MQFITTNVFFVLANFHIVVTKSNWETIFLSVNLRPPSFKNIPVVVGAGSHLGIRSGIRVGNHGYHKLGKDVNYIFWVSKCPKKNSPQILGLMATQLSFHGFFFT